MSLFLRPPSEILDSVGQRAQRLRRVRRLTQEELASRAGVGVATVKRFERSGRGSMEIALRVALALGAEGAFERLFEAPPVASLDEALARSTLPQRIRRRL